jgi:hypothetical protein
MSKLLREVCSYGALEVITEADTHGKSPKIKLRGLFTEADAKNGNGRRYPKKLIEREVKKLSKVVSERRLLGELDHPSDEVVHLANASHLVTDLQMDGSRVIGEIEILSTPAGKVLEELVKSGVKVGVSSRGVGTLTHVVDEDVYEVNDNLNMITWDMVSEPSCYGAFPGVVAENVLAESKTEKEVSHITQERMYIEAVRRRLEG